MSQIILTAFTLILLTQICYSQDANALIRAKFNENIDHIDYVFYSTDFEVGLYFGEINGKLYLLMIDLVTPCDA